MTRQEKIKYLEEKVEPIASTFTQVDDISFYSKRINICPINWGGGNVSIKYEDIDTLIKELQIAKQIIDDYLKFSKNS